MSGKGLSGKAKSSVSDILRLRSLSDVQVDMSNRQLPFRVWSVGGEAGL